MFKILFLAVVTFLFASIGNAQYLIPYYGKNNVKYDTFHWKTYKTTHFEIFFYIEAQEHLERVASMAESAYDKISAELQHDVEFRIPLIFFKTGSEFEQVNYLQISEGILGAAEPVFNRMAFAIDQPSDKLQRLVAHELAHVFEFSMLFGGMLSPVVRSSPPGWVMEGFADYATGVWDTTDLMVVRDAVLTERLPFLSISRDLLAPGGVELGRAPYNVGHAAFDFMKEKYGDAAVRQFWFYLKKATLLGGEDVIYSALGIKEEAFNEQFHHYLREKFSDYRSKQSPVDYGKEVALPAKYRQVFSQAMSPDASQFIVMTSNKDDYEFDILKIDRTGKVIDNLTSGSTTSYIYLTTDSFSFEGRNLSWSANGSRIAYFARTGKRRSLFVLNAADGHQVKKIKLKIDQAASPALSPDGRKVVITGFLEGKPDLFLIDIETEAISHLTSDILYEKTPIWSKDGKWLYYTTRIRSRDQIMRMDPGNPQNVEQITTSDYDSISPYYDAETNSIYYAANKGGAYNLYKLDLNTGDKLQFTDTIGSNFSPIVFQEAGKEKIAFTSFFKGQYRFFIMDLPQPTTIIAKGSEEAGEGTPKPTSEQLAKKFGAPGASVPTPTMNQKDPQAADFQPARRVTVEPGLIRDKKFRPILSGRPQVITGVSGDTFAVASGVAIQDILGDQEFRFYTSRIRGFQSYNVGYLDLGHRLQFLTDFIFNDDFFFAPVPNSIALQTGFQFDIVRDRLYGGRFVSQYPLNIFYRLEMGAGIFDLSQEFFDDEVQRLYIDFLNQTGQPDILNNGGYLPLSIAFVGETTRFREFGPISGMTFRLGVDYSVPVHDDWISRTTYDADFRKYFRMSNRSLIAARARGFWSEGSDLVIFSYGGGQDIRGFDFREVIGTRGAIGNLEYRFPVYPNPRTPVLGQLRARVFLDYFRSYLTEFEVNFTKTRFVDKNPFVLDFEEGAGSVGAGFTVFAGGLPFNFDFSKVYGQGRFRDPVTGLLDLSQPTQLKLLDGIHFDFSIGYDF